MVAQRGVADYDVWRLTKTIRDATSCEVPGFAAG
jgi:hypothetical protein